MSIKIEGLEQLIANLEDLQAKAHELDGTHQIPADELFSSQFMRRHTRFCSFGEMVAASGFKVESTEDFAAIPDQDWDQFIRQETSFPNWAAMQEAAGEEWVARKMGLR
jgi:hypothetical protein